MAKHRRNCKQILRSLWVLYKSLIIWYNMFVRNEQGSYFGNQTSARDRSDRRKADRRAQALLWPVGRTSCTSRLSHQPQRHQDRSPKHQRRRVPARCRRLRKWTRRSQQVLRSCDQVGAQHHRQPHHQGRSPLNTPALPHLQLLRIISAESIRRHGSSRLGGSFR